MSLLCLLDLSKCFDVIDHSKLLTKLQLHGIDTSWFSAYLRDHSQSVSFTDNLGNIKKSAPLPNSIGVFQGSALGPLLYCIFANDLSLFVEDAIVVQYADDTQILVSGKKSEFKNVIDKMEQVLASLDLWFRASGLKVNAGKTQLMLLGSPQNLRNTPHFTVKFRDHNLLPVSEAKNLGIIFDPTLSWDAHISAVIRRCFGILIGLSHLRNYLPPSVVSSVVNALALSQIRYCISVYGNGTQKNLSRVQKVINYAAKIIFGRKNLIMCRICWRSWAGSVLANWYNTTHCVWSIKYAAWGSPRHWPAALPPYRRLVTAVQDRTTVCTYRCPTQRWADDVFAAVLPAGITLYQRSYRSLQCMRLAAIYKAT